MTVMSGRKFENIVLRILGENRIMTIATLREDGWPQATIVGYIHDGVTLFCSVARDSQKHENIVRDPRASIAIGRRVGQGANLRGLSMAASVETVVDPDEETRINQMLWEHLPDIDLFAPRGAPFVVLRARPEVISILDTRRGVTQPVQRDWPLARARREA